MVLGFYAIAIDYAFGYTIVYTIGFPKCYDISYFIWNACNVNDYANGDVIGYAIGYMLFVLVWRYPDHYSEIWGRFVQYAGLWV